MTSDLVRIESAVISVYDKTGIKYLVSELLKSNPKIRIFSSGGTYSEIVKVAPDNVVEIASYIGFPEMPSGLVKTLHPKIHGGILGNEPEQEFMKKHGIGKIDLVVVNLYPFGSAADSSMTIEAVRVNIDIGGVSLIEAGCKNFLRVAVLTDPSEYVRFVELLGSGSGCTDLLARLSLSVRGLRHISVYLEGISGYFEALGIKDVKREYIENPGNAEK